MAGDALSVADAPRPDEILVVSAVANLTARLGIAFMLIPLWTPIKSPRICDDATWAVDGNNDPPLLSVGVTPLTVNPAR